MKLAGANARSFFAKPDPQVAFILLYGTEAVVIDERRKGLIKAIGGESVDADMRLTRLGAGELRRNPAQLIDEMKAVGFFPGPRIVHLEQATETTRAPIEHAIDAWREGDARLIVTAGSLTAQSKLRKLFEAHPKAAAIGIYDDPPRPDEIRDLCKEAGLAHIGPEEIDALMAIAAEITLPETLQFLTKLQLYTAGQPPTLSDISATAPLTTEADVDGLIESVISGRSEEIAPMLRRLYAQGVTPVTIGLMTSRYFRRLHAAASDPQGRDVGLSRLRPPVFGRRKEIMARALRDWPRAALEDALIMLLELELKLRSTHPLPQNASLERLLIRLSIMAKRRAARR